MNTKYKFFLFVLFCTLGLVGALVYYLLAGDAAVLHPSGSVAEKQRNLLITATLLMLIVIVPVFVLLFFIAIRFRASNTKARYRPNWDHNKFLEITWWAIPFAIIAILAVITYKSSHDLDPYKPLEHETKPITVQVVALQWKWLFIYPEQNIASVNFVQFPEHTPVNFEITADAPMNSFWIPELAGQVYAMNGMTTKLHVIADEPGDFTGVSANISGEGFADMKFVARASTRDEFNNWVAVAQDTGEPLGLTEYNQLAAPSIDASRAIYATKQDNLYDTIVMKYMTSHEHEDSGPPLKQGIDEEAADGGEHTHSH